MILIITCNNCQGIIYYRRKNIGNEIAYIQADPIHKDNKIIMWEKNIFKQIKNYFITCPQCEKETICGREVLQQRVHRGIF